MPKAIEVLRAKSLEILVVAIAGALGYLLTIVWKELSVPFAEKVLPGLSNQSLLAIVLIEFGLLLVAAFWIPFLYKKLASASISKPSILSKYEFDKRRGIYLDKGTGIYYCPSCLQSGVEAPLKEMEHGWECQVKTCAKFYRNPDYKEPPIYMGRDEDRWSRW